jgi:hypothetical protein
MVATATNQGPISLDMIPVSLAHLILDMHSYSTLNTQYYPCDQASPTLLVLSRYVKVHGMYRGRPYTYFTLVLICAEVYSGARARKGSKVLAHCNKVQLLDALKILEHTWNDNNKCARKESKQRRWKKVLW